MHKNCFFKPISPPNHYIDMSITSDSGAKQSEVLIHYKFKKKVISVLTI